MTVDTAIRNETKQMKPMIASSCEGLLRNAIARQFAIRKRFIYASQVLVNDSARAQIEMAHFRVSHLSFRQTDIRAAGAELAAGIIAIKLGCERGAPPGGWPPRPPLFFFSHRVCSPSRQK